MAFLPTCFGLVLTRLDKMEYRNGLGPRLTSIGEAPFIELFSAQSVPTARPG